jgi:hypothetical protein
LAKHGRLQKGLCAGLVTLLGLGALSAAGASDKEAPKRAEIRVTMQQIFESVRTLLPLSVSDSAYADPANRERIHGALESLAANASALASHGRRKDAGFGHLGRYLAADTRDIQRSFDAGEIERSQFLLRQLTEYCVTCHSRLPSPGDSPLSEHFVDQGTLLELSLEERATLLIATRRFDEGLAALEQLFASSATHPADLLSPLTD